MFRHILKVEPKMRLNTLEGIEGREVTPMIKL